MIYGIRGALFAFGFDLNRLAATTSPAPVVDGVVTKSTAADFDLSDEGMLVYVAGASSTDLRSLVWLDRQGHEEPTGMKPGPYIYARLSPDNTRVTEGR